jgi:hypothetical protein
VDAEHRQGISMLLANASRAYAGAEQQIGSSFQQGAEVT